MPVNLPNPDGLSDKGYSIIEATLSGRLPPDIGAQLINALSSQAKLVEIDELVRRIEALETASGLNETLRQSE
ncbi:MAG: hypothetical protein ACRERU_14455 [Methylococcales bacterium]